MAMGGGGKDRNIRALLPRRFLDAVEDVPPGPEPGQSAEDMKRAVRGWSRRKV